MHTIDLNADLGEGGEQDEALMAFASSANIACGGHAGNRESIRRAVGLAINAQVAIGAHPGYEDPAHFGRRPMILSAGEIRSLIHRQLERILAIHPRLHHVKPHGSLYNQANEDEAMASALVSAIAELQPDTILYSPPRGALALAAAAIKMATCPEGFIDRRYQDDGSLCPRTDERALIENADEAVSQAIQIAIKKSVTTLSGATIPLKAQTLCIHGDSHHALDLVTLTRSSLENAGIRISAP
ncbi:5-oxoprolinase subunit PxpA [Akkermansiaceae bacterium]|nr:5-oxoprolinase subunit PxpA [Akkermansiaceae bacterium]